MSDYSLGLATGLACGMLMFSGDVEKIEVPMEPTAIVTEDRNNDGLIDIIQQYSNGEEKILYAYRDNNYEIAYRLE